MAEDIRNGSQAKAGGLQVLDAPHYEPSFTPVKRIEDGEDLAFFLTSKAYGDIMTFLLQLNRSMFPLLDSASSVPVIHEWKTHSKTLQFSAPVMQLQALVQTFASIMDDAPPDTGPRRFGNLAFRKWYELVDKRLPQLLRQAVPETVWACARSETEREALEGELAAYLKGSLGCPQRLDYGTGHELSFLAFLGCIWKLNGFATNADGNEERGIVVGIIEPYLELVRKLILTYTLEPAGSHGVWGLDDHSFLPYIFGSAQLSPALESSAQAPNVGSLKHAPRPNDVTNQEMIAMFRETNMYFSAIGFIYDVKKGAFWEHSPTLFDISGIKDGWAKINKGMIKMYNAEVLSKFPVVQHFPFGSLFKWERDPDAKNVPSSVHAQNQPSQTSFSHGTAASERAQWASRTMTGPSITGTDVPRATNQASGLPQASMAAPWARKQGTGMPQAAGTAAPWARNPHMTMPPLQNGFAGERVPSRTNATTIRPGHTTANASSPTATGSGRPDETRRGR